MQSESWSDAVKKAKLEAMAKAAEQEHAQAQVEANRLEAAQLLAEKRKKDRLEADERESAERLASERRAEWERSHGVESRLDATITRLDQIIELLSLATKRLFWIAFPIYVTLAIVSIYMLIVL